MAKCSRERWPPAARLRLRSRSSQEPAVPRPLNQMAEATISDLDATPRTVDSASKNYVGSGPRRFRNAWQQLPAFLGLRRHVARDKLPDVADFHPGSRGAAIWGEGCGIRSPPAAFSSERCSLPPP